MNRRTTIITILFGILSALSTYFLLQSMDGFKAEIGDSKRVVKELKEQVNNIENNYKGQVGYWAAKNQHLISQIGQTEVALSHSKQQTNSLQRKIKLLISEGKTLKDTMEIMANCDSLKNQTTQFIEATNIRDSLCDDEISDLRCVIDNKDSIITTCENTFSLLKQVTDSSLARQDELIEKLRLADKKLRRSKLKSKVLSSAAMILATSTSILLLKQ